ncbi:MAG: hypothetical protein ABI824_06640, partial [Acidobacteriota bacterium]
MNAACSRELKSPDAPVELGAKDEGDSADPIGAAAASAALGAGALWNRAGPDEDDGGADCGKFPRDGVT